MPHHKHGFTIIEVSLVLAIAGLILVMAFIAVPTLQRQARDAKRKEDTMTFLQALKKYQQNNRGQLPKISYDNDGVDMISSIVNFKLYDNMNTWFDSPPENIPWVKFYNDYLGDNFTNPNGTKYSFYIQNIDECGSLESWCYDYISTEVSENGFDERVADFYIFPSSNCENGQPVKTSNSRNLAIVTLLESGTYCANL